MLIRGNGSIIPLDDKSRYRCRKWRLFVSTECGQKSRVFNGSWSEAKKALESFKKELSDKIPNNQTFEAYAASWLLWREKSGEYAPGTIANDTRDIRAINRSELAAAKLEDITPQMCRESLLWIKQHPVRKQGELSNTTMNGIYITLSAIFRQAVDDERLSRNPMDKIKPPKPDTKERPAMSPDELALFVERLSTLPLDGRVMTLYFMSLLGLRRGEACALADIDVQPDFVCVHQAIKERDGTIGEPKSKASRRVLPLPNLLADKIDEWRVKRALDGFSRAETLCCNTRGGVLRPQNLQRWWDKYASIALGCPGMTLHQLRHSNLSMVARYLSPFDLQRYAGWSSIEPARVYIHADMTQLEQAITAINWRSFTRRSLESRTGQQTKLLTC